MSLSNNENEQSLEKTCNDAEQKNYGLPPGIYERGIINTSQIISLKTISIV